MTALPSSERAMRAKLAAHTRWAKTPDRVAAMEALTTAAMGRFGREVDPNGELDPKIRAKLADNAKWAHYTKLAYLSAKARRLRQGQS